MRPPCVAYSGYRINDTVSRRYEFDADIYVGKLGVQGGLAGTGVAGIGLMFFAAPEPVVTKIAGGAILVGSVILGGADMVIDHIHNKRVAARQRLLEKLTVEARHGAIDDILRKMID